MPGIPKTPTTAALNGFIASPIPQIPPIKFKTKSMIPPIILLNTNLMNHLKGIKRIHPKIYSKIRPNA